MSNVIDFQAEKIKQDWHTTGPVICVGCNHKWIGVIPGGVRNCECPECGLMKGVREGIVSTGDLEYWQCDCGCDMYHIIKDYNAMCIGCGALHERG